MLPILERLFQLWPITKLEFYDKNCHTSFTDLHYSCLQLLVLIFFLLEYAQMNKTWFKLIILLPPFPLPITFVHSCTQTDYWEGVSEQGRETWSTKHLCTHLCTYKSLPLLANSWISKHTTIHRLQGAFSQILLDKVLVRVDKIKMPLKMSPLVCKTMGIKSYKYDHAWIFLTVSTHRLHIPGHCKNNKPLFPSWWKWTFVHTCKFKKSSQTASKQQYTWTCISERGHNFSEKINKSGSMKQLT